MWAVNNAQYIWHMSLSKSASKKVSTRVLRHELNSIQDKSGMLSVGKGFHTLTIFSGDFKSFDT